MAVEQSQRQGEYAVSDFTLWEIIVLMVVCFTGRVGEGEIQGPNL